MSRYMLAGVFAMFLATSAMGQDPYWAFSISEEIGEGKKELIKDIEQVENDWDAFRIRLDAESERICPDNNYGCTHQFLPLYADKLIASKKHDGLMGLVVIAGVVGDRTKFDELFQDMSSMYLASTRQLDAIVLKNSSQIH